MTAMRAGSVARALKSTGDLAPVIVVFGPDRGRVVDVVEHIRLLFGDAADDPFAVTKLDAQTVSDDPANLIDEARTVPLFGGQRLLIVRSGVGKRLEVALKVLLEEPPTDAIVVIEEGDLKKTSPVRKMAEANRHALAIECPADTVADLERMVDEEAAMLGLGVEADARAMLVALLGGDRGASRAEVTKVCLHAMDDGLVTIGDVLAVSGDVAVSGASEAVDAAFLGDVETLERVLARVMQTDTSAGTVLMTATWTVQSLERAAQAVARGASAQTVLERARPPIYGARKAAMGRVLSRWSADELRSASAAIAAAVWQSRIRVNLGRAAAHHTLLAIATKTLPSPDGAKPMAAAMREMLFQKRVVR